MGVLRMQWWQREAVRRCMLQTLFIVRLIHYGALRSTMCVGKTSDMNAWSSLLPCKAGPAVGACYPPSGPGLVIVSPATVVGAGSATDTAIHGSKRGATPRGVGGGGSELFLSRVCRHEFLCDLSFCLTLLVIKMVSGTSVYFTADNGASPVCHPVPISC